MNTDKKLDQAIKAAVMHVRENAVARARNPQLTHDALPHAMRGLAEAAYARGQEVVNDIVRQNVEAETAARVQRLLHAKRAQAVDVLETCRAIAQAQGHGQMERLLLEAIEVFEDSDAALKERAKGYVEELYAGRDREPIPGKPVVPPTSEEEPMLRKPATVNDPSSVVGLKVHGSLDLRRLSGLHLDAVGLVVGYRRAAGEDDSAMRRGLLGEHSATALFEHCTSWLLGQGWGLASDRTTWMKGGERLMLHQAVLLECETLAKSGLEPNLVTGKTRKVSAYDQLPKAKLQTPTY